MNIKSLPLRLYKYMSLDRFLSNIRSNSIRYTQPAFLNDPYECHLTIDRQQLFEDYRRFRKERQPNISDEALDKFVTNAESTLLVQALENYRTLRNSLGVLSLTEDPLNMLMWSHYGDEHKGVVIELDIWDSAMRSGSGGRDEYSTIEQVLYTNSKISGIPNSQNIVRAISTKSSEWAYEKEWRLVRTLNTLDCKNDEIYTCRLCLNDVKKIYLGAGFPANKLSEITNITSSHEGQHIEVIKLYIAPHKFELLETGIEEYAKKVLHRLYYFGDFGIEALACLPLDEVYKI